MPPEKHISVPKEEVLLALRNRLGGDGAKFDELVHLMEGVASFDFMDLKDRMRTNFLPFASGARNQVRRCGSHCFRQQRVAAGGLEASHWCRCF